ncbi:DNA-protecting protein DprA [Candidatus Daviesbacteria bacterium]|nr:DNA-protecting protein DprA [Candidatus Daviesbacteria bacterium]
MKNLAYLLALHSIDGLGPIRLKKVLDHFEDPKLAWLATLHELKALSIPDIVIANLEDTRKSLIPEQFLEKVIEKDIKILTIFDENYPKLLKQIYDPPIVLYYKGNFIFDEEKTIAVVGTRKVSSYGKLVTEKFTRELVEAGFSIVSGLAKGVDTLAHKTTVFNKGKTVAILGSGIDYIFPSENSKLALEIIENNGIILSEFPPKYPPLPGNFPSRNRIIAGLSLAVLVTEASGDSGSLITAHLAIEYGREVFAVPGPITSKLSIGPAKLIKEGAKLVYETKDILEELGVDNINSSKEQIKPNLTGLEMQIYNLLENETKHIDELCRLLKQSAANISSSLMKMEIQGIVRNLGGGVYSRL